MNAKSERPRLSPAPLVRAFRLTLLSLFTALPLASHSSGAAAAESASVTVSVTPDSVLVGDRIRYTIGVRHPQSETVSLEGLERMSAEPFALVSSNKNSSKLTPLSRRERFELELAVFGSGHQILPPFTVVFRDPAGQVTRRIVCSSPTSVFVRAITDSSIHDLRPIKPPIKPSIPLLLILPVILGAAGIALVVLLVIYVLKRIVTRSAERIDPGQVAQRKLRKLGTRLSAGMPPPECYEELSNIMRSFLEKHYRIRALEAVTQEIERDLKKLGVAGFENIMNLLKQADLVKFADSRPDIEESRQSLQSAEAVIRSARVPEQ